MVKIMVECDDFKKEFRGRYAAIMVGDPEEGGDAISGMLGISTFKEIAELIGKSAGAQFRELAPRLLDQKVLADIVIDTMDKVIVGGEVDIRATESVIRPVDGDKR